MKLHNGFNEGENFVFVFENGKGVRVPLIAYETKSPRKKLINAYSSASPIAAVFHEVEKNPFEIILVSDAARAIIIKTSLIPVKNTRTSAGVTLMNLKKNQKLVDCRADFEQRYPDTKGCKKLKIPAQGAPLPDSDLASRQLTID
jgi:DNA gyrase subunit A